LFYAYCIAFPPAGQIKDYTIGICLIGATSLPAGCCFSELAPYKSN